MGNGRGARNWVRYINLAPCGMIIMEIESFMN